MVEQTSEHATRTSYFVRRVTAMQDFEVFFVSSVATLSAGIGFGLFLHELGKFITSDNDYSFVPAVAIMYVLFVVPFFLFRWLGRMDRMSPETALVNSFDFAKEAIMRAMSAAERDEALSVLGRADHADPTVRTLAVALRQVTPPVIRPNVAIMTAARVKSWYRGIIGRRWFQRLVMGWFLLTSVVAILVGAFFSFYQDQVGAIFGLLWLLVQLAVIRSMIAAQLASSETRPQTTSDGGDHGTHQV
ncbi:MAG: hypothetical protein IH629_02510 [Thermoleophilia bacterium]|nr:hypothetical protein [Thermoleophilia bacterium]